MVCRLINGEAKNGDFQCRPDNLNICRHLLPFRRRLKKSHVIRVLRNLLDEHESYFILLLPFPLYRDSTFMCCIKYCALLPSRSAKYTEKYHFPKKGRRRRGRLDFKPRDSGEIGAKHHGLVHCFLLNFVLSICAIYDLVISMN